MATASDLGGRYELGADEAFLYPWRRREWIELGHNGRAEVLKSGEMREPGKRIEGADGHDCVSNALRKNAAASRLRSLPDRLRQVALYEIGGMCLISPLFAMITGASPGHTAGLLLMLSLAMAAWNALYSTAFDWAQQAITGRTADERPPLLRAGHAVMLEAGGVAATAPVIAAWGSVSWRVAVLEDFGLTLAYCAYALCFGLIYDSLFPIDSEIDDCGGYYP
jgi:uncharacterized membrane protein